MPTYISIKDLHDWILANESSFDQSCKTEIKSSIETSPLLHKTISEFNKVKHIVENASVLDVMIQDGGFVLN